MVESIMTIGERLANMRRRKGLSIRKVSTILGISEDDIGQLETRSQPLFINQLIKLADLYNVSLDFLLLRTECEQSTRILESEFIPLVTYDKLILRLERIDMDTREEIEYMVLLHELGDALFKASKRGKRIP